MNALVLPSPNGPLSLYRDGEAIVLKLEAVSPPSTAWVQLDRSAATQIRDALTAMLGDLG